VLLVGNLKTKRDLSDVRDIVRGYWLALERGRPGEVYNLCSETMWSMEEVLDILLSKSEARPRVLVDQNRLRPSDVPVLCGDSTKVRRETGWHPEIPLDRTLEDLLNYWRGRLKTDITGGNQLIAAGSGKARGRG
ncbi:MAG: GDP-mannose 4,6-dehydratase, partial [Candidatus Methylomirabilales bacterium]